MSISSLSVISEGRCDLTPRQARKVMPDLPTIRWQYKQDNLA